MLTHWSKEVDFGQRGQFIGQVSSWRADRTDDSLYPHFSNLGQVMAELSSSESYTK